MERFKGPDGIVEEVTWMIEWRGRVQDPYKGGLGLPLGGAHTTKVGLRYSYAVMQSKGAWPLREGTSQLIPGLKVDPFFSLSLAPEDLSPITGRSSQI